MNNGDNIHKSFRIVSARHNEMLLFLLLIITIQQVTLSIHCGSLRVSLNVYSPPGQTYMPGY